MKNKNENERLLEATENDGDEPDKKTEKRYRKIRKE